MATAPAEQTIAAQRAAEQPPPTGVGAGAATAAGTAALSIAATGAAVAAAAQVAPAEAPQAALNAINTAAAGILATFDAFLSGRRAAMQDHVEMLLVEDHPGLPEAERWKLIDTELQAEKAYAAAVRERLDRDLPPALALEPAERAAAVRRILDRERRVQEQREAAVEARAAGAANLHAVKAASPEGAFWWLNPKIKTHTADCKAMGGKAWPWSILDVFHPPLCGPWCACELWTIDRAVRAGLIRREDIQSGEHVAAMVHVHEAAADEGELDARSE